MASRLWSMEWLAPEPLMSASMAHGDPEKRVGKRRRRSVEVKVFGTWGTHIQCGREAAHSAHRRHTSLRRRRWYTQDLWQWRIAKEGLNSLSCCFAATRGENHSPSCSVAPRVSVAHHHAVEYHHAVD